ncbi:MAG: hypothetical protein OEQ29_19605 [Alphaproteobacteria bacterium]|nr:hypothetical protein [Alphaproteobacteria bacterium]
MRMILAALAAIVIATPAFSAGMACHNRGTVKQHLSKNYKEKSIALGVANNGGVVELFTAKDGKTWTIVITLPTGPTCLIAAGKDWEDLPLALYGKAL